MGNATPRRYVFYAEANYLTAQVDGNTPHIIPEQGFQRLPVYGGTLNGANTGFNEAGLISIKNGYANLTGAANPAGWSTTVEVVVQNLNIANQITADEVIAKITTEYPKVGNVPSISFQGTHFVNLKVGGKLVNPVLNLNLCGPKPAGDVPWINDAAFLLKAQTEFSAIATSGAPAEIAGAYAGWNFATVQARGKVDCSLVTGVNGLPGQSFGHVIVIPGFGNLYLAELAVGTHVELTMLRVDVTSQGKTQLRTVTADSQGHGMP